MSAKVSSFKKDREALSKPLVDSTTVELETTSDWSESAAAVAREGEGSEARERNRRREKSKKKEAAQRTERREKDLRLIAAVEGG